MPYEPFSSMPNEQTPNSKRKDIEIIDIRSHHESEDLAQQIRDSLKTPINPQEQRHIPSVLLWDQEGLKRFEKITHLDEYYLTQTEIDILEQSSHEIARKLQPKSLLIELGSGSVLFAHPHPLVRVILSIRSGTFERSVLSFEPWTRSISQSTIMLSTYPSPSSNGRWI